MSLDDLPSRTIAQHGMKCPDTIISALRSWIDVDVLWDIDAGCCQGCFTATAYSARR